MKKIYLVLIIFFSIFSNTYGDTLRSNDFGDDNWYLFSGLTIGLFDSQGSVTPCTYEDYTSGIIIGGGYKANQYIAVEARYLRTFFGSGENGGEKIEHSGLYLKPSYPASEILDIYALFGYGWSKSMTDGNGNLPEVDESAFSWGVGFSFYMAEKSNSDHWGLFAEYQSLLDNRTTHFRNNEKMISMGVFSIGLVYSF